MVHIDIVMNSREQLDEHNDRPNTISIGIDSRSAVTNINRNDGPDGSRMGNRIGTDGNNAGGAMSNTNDGMHPGGDSGPLPRSDGNMTGAMVTRPSSKTMSASSAMSRLEVLLSSFSSLLSSAHTNGTHHSLLPPEDSSHSLSKLLARSNSNSVSSVPCSIPCLRLRNDSSSLSLSLNTANQQSYQKISMHDVMALNLSSALNANSSNVNFTPKILLKNIAGSFRELVMSRMRVSIQAITRTILKVSPNGTEARVLRRLLTTANPIKITTVVTSFQVINQEDTHKNNQNDHGNYTDTPTVKPLTFEAIVDLSILGKMYTITLEAPGTITASLDANEYLLDNVHIVLDTMRLLRGMMTQARAVVKKAIKRAATITTTVATYQSKKAPADNGYSSSSTQSRNRGDLYKDSPPNSSDFLENSSQQPQNGNNLSSGNQNQRNDLLASYPDHLRETVQHFLPAAEMDDTINIEGFPPNLLKTLKSLSGDDQLALKHRLSPDINGSSESGAMGREAQRRQEQAERLHQGLFSWINNDDMMLKRSNKNNSNNDSSRNSDTGNSDNQHMHHQEHNQLHHNNNNMSYQQHHVNNDNQYGSMLSSLNSLQQQQRNQDYDHNQQNQLKRKYHNVDYQQQQQQQHSQSNHLLRHHQLQHNQSHQAQNYNHDRSSSTQPLSKRNKKVSFILPNR